MRILLIGNYVSDRQESMQRFANLLANGLIQYGHEVILIRPEPVFGKLKPTITGFGKWLGYLDKFLIFPHQLCQYLNWADVVHICDHSNAFYTKYLQNIPHVVTCNDVLAIRSAQGEIPENPTRWTGRQLQKIILRGLRRSQRIVCISENTKIELLRISQIDQQKASVIYMGMNYPYAPMAKSDALKYLNNLRVPLDSPFILHVGGNQWYKNRLGVLEIFCNLRQSLSHIPNLYLVMAGKPFTANMQEFIYRQNLQNYVKELVSVSNEDLQALYSLAIALLFPSLQEGFGWPIIEAQVCGCPVFTSNRAPMTEIGGDSVIYINPAQPVQAAQQMAANLFNLEPIKRAGFINAQQFNTDKMLQAYCQIYEEIQG